MKLRSIPSAFEAVTGFRPHPTTAWRWWKQGVDGVKLETFVVGGRRMTTTEAVSRFIEERTAKASGEPTVSRTRAKLNAELGL